MRVERLLVWLPLIGMAACSPAVTAVLVPRHEQSGALTPGAVGVAVLVLPLVMALRGLRRAIAQLDRTCQAIRYLVLLPKQPAAPVVAALAHKLDIQARLDVVISTSAEAFCYGLLRPRICVTTGLLHLLSLDELEAVLRHERHHLRRRDPLRVLVWTAIDGGCWWNKGRGEQARLRRELAADRAVIAAGGRAALAGALLKLLACSGESLAAGDLAIGGLSVTDARIDQLLGAGQRPPRRLPSYRRVAPPLAITLTLLLCSL